MVKIQLLNAVTEDGVKQICKVLDVKGGAILELEGLDARQKV
jgi:hypothetical protein